MKKIQIVILIAFCCTNTFGQVVKDSNADESKNRSPQISKPTASNSIASETDETYRVYAAVLKKEKRLLVIRDKTNVDKDSKDIKQLEQRGFKSFLELVIPETITDFLAKNDESEPLERKFPSDIDYTFISIEELTENFAYKIDGEMNWEDFRKKYPKTGNIYTLSRVGFSQDGTQALVFVTDWCRRLCGEGNYYLLKKENSEWKIVNETMTWIS